MLQADSRIHILGLCLGNSSSGFQVKTKFQRICRRFSHDVSSVSSSIGLLFTLFTTVIFIRYNKTPIIMASGRELCYVLLIGIAICYLMTFVILSPPSTIMCTCYRLGTGLSLCICYSAIFTKTNRISRIFNRGAKSIKRPGYTSPKSQIVICSGQLFNTSE